MSLPPRSAHLASAPPPGPAWQVAGRGAPEPPQRGSCARRGPRGPGWGRHRRRSLGSCAGLGREAGQEFPEASSPREGRRGGVERWRSHPGCGQLWASRVWEWGLTHSEGWAHRQRPPHASRAPCGLGLERQQGPPASLRRTSSWAHAVVSATTLNDNCCVLDTHTLTHLPPTPTHSLAQTSMKCDPKHTPIEILSPTPYPHTQGSILRCSAQIRAFIHSCIQQVFIKHLFYPRCWGTVVTGYRHNVCP